MIREEKLNSLVGRYREGDENALRKLVGIFLPIVTNQSNLIWHQVESETEFECRCLMRIKKAIENYDPTRGKLRSLITNVVMKEKFDFLSRRGRKINNVMS